MPRASATASALGGMSEANMSSRPSAGTYVAVVFGGTVTTANDDLIVTASGGNTTVLAATSATRGADARAVTLIAARASPPASVTSTSRTKPCGVISTTGIGPDGLDTPPAPTGIESPVNEYRVRSEAAPSKSTPTSIAPVCVRFTPGPPNATVCIGVPSPRTSASDSAARPPGPVTIPYTGPSWPAGGPIGCEYATTTVLGPANCALAVAAAGTSGIHWTPPAKRDASGAYPGYALYLASSVPAASLRTSTPVLFSWTALSLNRTSCPSGCPIAWFAAPGPHGVSYASPRTSHTSPHMANAPLLSDIVLPLASTLSVGPSAPPSPGFTSIAASYPASRLPETPDR